MLTEMLVVYITNPMTNTTNTRDTVKAEGPTDHLLARLLDVAQLYLMMARIAQMNGVDGESDNVLAFERRACRATKRIAKLCGRDSDAYLAARSIVLEAATMGAWVASAA